jgi:DNA-binding transcriptional LysR family regulator
MLVAETEIMHVLRDELPRIEIAISSKHSPQLAEGLATGKLDAAFMRAEAGYPDLVYKVLISEPLISYYRAIITLHRRKRSVRPILSARRSSACPIKPRFCAGS